MLKFNLYKQLFYRQGFMDLRLNAILPAFSVTAIMGGSGEGKTSLLKMLAGLTKPDSGEIIVSDKIWYSSEKKISLAPQQRSIGFLFQEYALFPHMTVKENLAFALDDKQQVSQIANLLEMTGMTGFENAKPNTLSGGQQQRVALARAVINRPALLLLDEPLSALDQQMRNRLQQDLKVLLACYPATVLLVTHDESEAARLASHVMIIDQGKPVKFGNTWEILGKGTINEQIIKAEVIHIDESKQEIAVLWGGKLLTTQWHDKDNLPLLGQIIDLPQYIN